MSVSRKNILDALSEVRAKKGERNFRQSVDLVVNLRDIDLKRPENRVNLNVNLPNTIPKSQKICFFATGDLGLRARRAAVDLVVDQDQLRDLSTKRKDAKKLLSKYDIFLAEASLMPIVGRVAGPILGPRGKMPTPVPSNAPIEQFIERQRRAVALRTRDKPLIELSVGTEDMEDEKIAENVEALLTSLIGGLKRGLSNVKSIYLKTTMGEPVRLR